MELGGWRADVQPPTASKDVAACEPSTAMPLRKDVANTQPRGLPMTDIMLPEPRAISQAEHTCWAAAAESWVDANRRLNGITSARPITTEGLVNMFRGAGYLEARDRLSDQFWGPFSQVLGMRLTVENPARVTVQRVARWLAEDGYVYLVGRRRGHHVSHVVVVFGIQGNVVHFMEPLFGAQRRLPLGQLLAGMAGVGVGRPLLGRAPRNPFLQMFGPASSASPRLPSNPLMPGGGGIYMGSPGPRG
jgi:hypothetical protein